VKFSTLQEYGVEKLFVLENRNVETTQRNVVFLARGEKPKQVQAVAQQIKHIRQESSVDHDFTIIWFPRRTLLSDRILEENGVLGEANITQFPLYFISLEPDILSLELEDAFSDVYLRKDPTSIFHSAKALMLLQKSSGLFPRILGKGDNARRLADLLIRMRSEEDVNASSDPSNTYLSGFGMTPSSVVDNLIIVDREVDFATALLTQLTYEGLIDETFGIRYNQAEVDTSVIGAGPQSQSSGVVPQNAPGGNPGAMKRKIQLDSSDKLYPELRDANFAVVGPLLNKTARRLQSDYETRHKADQSISDLKSFVAKLPAYQLEQASLRTHTSLAEEIMKLTRGEVFGRSLEIQQNFAAGSDPSTMHDSIEELISRDVPLSTILRLLSLESSISGGLRQRDLEYFKRLIIYAYGHQHILTFSALEKMGLLVPRTANTGYLNPMSAANAGSTTDYTSIRKSLRLWIEDVDEQDPEDISYVFSGYAPLSVRIVQCALQKTYLSTLTNSSSRNKDPSKNTQLTPTTTNTNDKNGAKQQQQPLTHAQSPGWKGFEDILARIKGATVDEIQRGADADASKARAALRGNTTGSGTTGTTSIVFFLGGITYAEIAALRFVGKQLAEKGKGRKLLICTTGIIGGNGIVGAAVGGGDFGIK